MKNKFLLILMIASFATLFIAVSFSAQKNNNNYQIPAQTISTFPITIVPRSPTPTPTRCGSLQSYSFKEACGGAEGYYRYISYTCQGGYQATQGSSSSCKDSNPWINYATYDCQKNSFCLLTPTPVYRTPTPPIKITSKYVYITYTCRNDSTGGSYVLANTNRCRSGAEWMKDANNSCYQKTSGTCAATGTMSGCVETYKYSPECAVKPNYITPTSYKSPTPTPGCNNYTVWFIKYPFDYNNDGVINILDYQIWMQKNPGVVLCPSKTPTPTCIPAPSCLYTEPRCLMPEPIGGWCKLTPTPYISNWPTIYPTRIYITSPPPYNYQ